MMPLECWAILGLYLCGMEATAMLLDDFEDKGELDMEGMTDKSRSIARNMAILLWFMYVIGSLGMYYYGRTKKGG